MAASCCCFADPDGDDRVPEHRRDDVRTVVGGAVAGDRAARARRGRGSSFGGDGAGASGLARAADVPKRAVDDAADRAAWRVPAVGTAGGRDARRWRATSCSPSRCWSSRQSSSEALGQVTGASSERLMIARYTRDALAEVVVGPCPVRGDAPGRGGGLRGDGRPDRGRARRDPARRRSPSRRSRSARR